MKTTPRARLLLVELICDLLIFATCAAVCVTLLVYARKMSADSRDLTNAVYVAQAAAEGQRLGHAPIEEIEGYHVGYVPSPDGATCAISISKNGRELYTLEEVATP